MAISKTLLAAALLTASTVSAADVGDTFTVNCSPLTTQRRDPILSFGKDTSDHVHAVIGGTAFKGDTTNQDAINSKATTCDKILDHSIYWVPQMYHITSDNKYEIVPFKGSAVYYQNRACDYQAGRTSCPSIQTNFAAAPPAGLRVISGNKDLRTFNKDDITQRAVSHHCVGSIDQETNSLPVNHCDTIRSQVTFPPCWDGVNLDSDDHKSHMAYPNMIDGGSCPEGFDTRVPSLFYETIWNTYKFKDSPGQFVWSNGDPTGYGYHADFINGWNIDTLQSAVSTCTNPSGRVEDCPVFSGSLQTESEQATCKIQSMPKVLSVDDCAGPSNGLCGNVPVQYGPEYAAPLEGGDKDDEEPVTPTLSSVAPVPTQSYAPARSMGAGGISVYNVESPSTMVKSSSSADYGNYPAAPAVTPLADIVDAVAGDEAVSTSTYTKDGVVYEVAIVEVVVTTTVGADYRRHAHKHRRGHFGRN